MAAPERIKATAPAPGLPISEGMQPRARDAQGRLLPRAKPQQAQAPEATETDPVLNNGVKRVPLGQHVAKLAYPPRPGFVRRWISDLPGRVDRALEAGWSHVKQGSNPVKQVTDPNMGQGGRLGFIMEIPQDLYDEDQKAKSDSLDEVDNAIYNGVYNQEAGDKRYNPQFAPNKNEVRRGSGKV